MEDKQRTRTLLVKDREGEFKVEVPSDAKLTLGPAVPFKQRDGYSSPGSNSYCLRVYKGSKEHILAVFNSVEWFRDVTLPVSRLVIREAGKSVWKSDENGYKVEAAVHRERAWDDQLKMLEEGKGED